jgi:hypothetical protein
VEFIAFLYYFIAGLIVSYREKRCIFWYLQKAPVDEFEKHGVADSEVQEEVVLESHSDMVEPESLHEEN